jgi:hypothetical protein
VGKRISGKTGKTNATKRVTERPGVTESEWPGVTESPSQYLVWRFGRLDHETEFGCHTLLGADARNLEGELEVFQQEKISVLRHKKWLKFIGEDDMTPAGRKALAEVNAQENGLWQLHLHRNKWRVWGYFEDPEFFFVWWDDNHDVATGRSRRRKS